MHHRLLSIPLAAVLAAGVCAAPALAGTDGDTTPAPVIPPAPATVPVVPAPATPTVPTAQVKQATQHHAAHSGNSNSHKSSKSSPTRQHKTVVQARRTSTVVHTVLASATPTGGVQAGAGGTAVRPGDDGLAILAPGALALLMLAGTGLRTALKRR